MAGTARAVTGAGRARCVGMGGWGLLTAAPPGPGRLVPSLAWDEWQSNINWGRCWRSLVEGKGRRQRLCPAEEQPLPGQPDPMPPAASLPCPASRELLGERGRCCCRRSLSLVWSRTEALTVLSSRAQQLHVLLSINSVGSLEVTSGLRVKQHGINLKTTAFIFSSILEKPVWLMLVMTQQNLS